MHDGVMFPTFSLVLAAGFWLQCCHFRAIERKVFGGVSRTSYFEGPGDQKLAVMLSIVCCIALLALLTRRICMDMSLFKSSLQLNLVLLQHGRQSLPSLAACDVLTASES
jgi:hypothetical protein